MGDLEEEEDFEAFEMRQQAEDAIKTQEQEQYDKRNGKDKRSSGSERSGSDYDSEDDLERDADGNYVDADGNIVDVEVDEYGYETRVTKDSSSPENLGKTKLG